MVCNAFINAGLPSFTGSYADWAQTLIYLCEMTFTIAMTVGSVKGAQTLTSKAWERPGEVKSSVSIPYEKVEEISRKLNVIVYETQQSADSDGLAFKQSIAKSKQCYVLLRIMRKIVKGKGKCDRQAVDAEFVIELDGEESKLFKEMFAELLK